MACAPHHMWPWFVFLQTSLSAAFASSSIGALHKPCTRATAALANCCFDWVVRPGWHGTQEEKLKALYQRICREYQEQGIESSNRIRRLPLSAFCNPKAKYDNFPSLSGIKARHCRYLVPVFLQICDEFQDPAEPYTAHRFKCLKNLDEMYQIMDASPMHPSRKQSKDFKKCMDTCLLHYNRLSCISIDRQLLMWNTVPKFHLAAHLADQFKWMNPRYYSCYGGETMVGHMSAVAHSTLNGTAAWQVPIKVCWRYRLGFHLRNQGSEFQFDEVDSD